VKALILKIDRITTGTALVIAALLLALIACLGLWQVITRFVLAQPSVWTEESMRRLLIWAVMLGGVAAFRQGAMVSVDLMQRLSRGWWRTTVRALILLVTAIFLVCMIWFGVDLSWRVRFQTFASLNLSMAWAYAAIPIGAALSLISVLAQWLDPRSTELESVQ
jgi:TRAP-type C4-dicarboxylate transport system permease small subunit